MSLKGNYFCQELNSRFVIEKADDSNGQASGYFELDNITIPVNIHYHFKNSAGPATNLWFSGNMDDPNEYVGGAGLTDNRNYALIQVAGGYPTNDSVKTFEGSYKRQ